MPLQALRCPKNRAGRIYASTPADRPSAAILRPRNSAHNSGHSAHSHLRKRTNAQFEAYLLAKQALYQLSYGPCVDEYSCAPLNSQEHVREAHSEPINRTALEERLLF